MKNANRTFNVSENVKEVERAKHEPSKLINGNDGLDNLFVTKNQLKFAC
ncbi:15835_t:CDS:2 [Cetraspora pellucida]|uniref:15835_t:CDS:1 n=1 Tax=Cetraspora pellucida TaxID=1433469 RepID=A0A9N9E6C9_9GLOM|nr:15835_t:CDS:2 [Cetraspora pellucida]